MSVESTYIYELDELRSESISSDVSSLYVPDSNSPSLSVPTLIRFKSMNLYPIACIISLICLFFPSPIVTVSTQRLF